MYKALLLTLAASALVNCAPKSSSDDLNPVFTVDFLPSVDKRAGAPIVKANEIKGVRLLYTKVPQEIAQATDEAGRLVNVEGRCAKIETESILICYKAQNNTNYLFESGNLKTGSTTKCSCENRGRAAKSSTFTPGSKMYGLDYKVELINGIAGLFIKTKLTLGFN